MLLRYFSLNALSLINAVLHPPPRNCSRVTGQLPCRKKQLQYRNVTLAPATTCWNKTPWLCLQVRAAEYMRTAKALYDFAMRHPGTATNRVWDIGFTYDTTYEQTYRLWASAVLAFATSCSTDGSPKTKFCDKSKAGEYVRNAWSLWNDPTVR